MKDWVTFLEILVDEKTYFLGKSHVKVSLAKFFLTV